MHKKHTPTPSSTIPRPVEGEDEVHRALLTFTDFIYAIVFVIIVQLAFDEVFNKRPLFNLDAIVDLIGLGSLFYFFMWDWILGRILTLHNPYKSHTRFLFELFIASFAYGTVSAFIKHDEKFIFSFGAVLMFGALWAMRTEHQLVRQKDAQELCMIQLLQFSGGGITMIAFFARHIFLLSGPVSLVSECFFIVALWGFILLYEIMVPRTRSMDSGPGFPFLRNSGRLRVRRFLFAE